jgi:surface antigen/LysM repeat protein
VIVVIAVALISYSALSRNSEVSAWLGASHTASATTSVGSGGSPVTTADIQMGGDGSIVQPAAIPAAAPVQHTASSYTVGASDTLKGIASRYHVTADELRWSNQQNLTDTDQVKPGETLSIPPVAGVVITVQRGDTLQSLSQTWHVQPDDIVNFNYLRDPQNEITPGTVLVLPGAVGPRLPSPNSRPPSFISTDDGVLKVGGSIGPVVPNHFPIGQCTYYVASRTAIAWMGDAWTWFGSAKAYGWQVGVVPRVGSIEVTWESQLYGHVAYVEQVYADGSYRISEMNFVGWNVVDQRLVKPGRVPLIGFLYPPQQ